MEDKTTEVDFGCIVNGSRRDSPLSNSAYHCVPLKLEPDADAPEEQVTIKEEVMEVDIGESVKSELNPPTSDCDLSSLDSMEVKQEEANFVITVEPGMVLPSSTEPFPAVKKEPEYFEDDIKSNYETVVDTVNVPSTSSSSARSAGATCYYCNKWFRLKRKARAHIQRHLPSETITLGDAVVKEFTSHACGYHCRRKSNHCGPVKKHFREESTEINGGMPTTKKIVVRSSQHRDFVGVSSQVLDEHVALCHDGPSSLARIGDNSVQFIKQNYSHLSVENQRAIRDLGRPMPDLLKHVQPSNVRKFSMSNYSMADWLCGCDVTNKLYCFPCLMFSKKRSDQWVRDGIITDLSGLTYKIKKHECSSIHKNATIDSILQDKQNLQEKLVSSHRQSQMEKAETVRKNRYILNKIIECIKFCSDFELGSLELGESSNPDLINGLVNFTAESDTILREHLKEATLSEFTSKEVQNDLLECMLRVCHSSIGEEMKITKFVAVIADEIENVTGALQVSVVFRYVLPNGNPVERFWKFVEPSNNDAHSLAASLTNSLAEAGVDPDKLICQSYDGLNILNGKDVSVHSLIAQKFPQGHYVPSSDHQLHLIIKQASNRNKYGRIFFSDLLEITEFFSHSSQREAILGEILEKRRPKHRWPVIGKSFQTKPLLIIYYFYDEILECMQKIENESVHGASISQARSVRLKMEEPIFQFFLEVFSSLFLSDVQKVFDKLQAGPLHSVYKHNNDSGLIETNFANFESCVLAVQDRIDKMIKSSDFPVDLRKPSRKGRRVESELQATAAAAKEICDVIIILTKDRFQFTGHLIARYLLDEANFPRFNIQFPSAEYNELSKAFPFVTNDELKSDLKVLYSRVDFGHEGGPVPLLQLLIKNRAESVLPELTSLLKRLVTMPTTPKAEQTCSTLERIKTVVRDSVGSGDRLNALTMISVEKDMICSIDNFNDQVIDLFANKKGRKMDLIYNT